MSMTKVIKKEIDTAFEYIPDETNNSVIYMKEPIPISVGIKPVKFCEESSKVEKENRQNTKIFAY